MDKYLADMGIGTRTQVKELIRKGCVQQNEQVVRRPEIKVDTERDRILCNGNHVGYVQFQYFMMNKPTGVITATEDKRQKTVLELLNCSVKKGFFPVGRLDKDAEGLLLITNDGALAHNLLSPKKHVPKRYLVTVKGIFETEDIKAFKEGLAVPEYDRFEAFTAKSAVLDILETRTEPERSAAEIEICEGKFHQVKRMCQAVGKPVLSLKRISIGGLFLDCRLRPGEYRELTQKERNLLIG